MAEDFQFIRLLFPLQQQEEAAVRLLRALTRPLGHHAILIRPETKVEEMVAWAEAEGTDTVDLVAAFDAGMGVEADSLADGLERMTFRELVERACEKDI
jgi:hypothetical protein